VSSFRSFSSDKIDLSQIPDITDYNDLIASHLQPSTPSGGFTIVSSVGVFVVQSRVFNLTESNFIF
jgi:hypothetical protein